MDTIVILNYTDCSVWIYDIPKDVDAEDFISEKGFKPSDVHYMIGNNIPFYVNDNYLVKL